MVRGLVAWAFFKVEWIDVWARVFDSGLVAWAFLKSKGSKFKRACSFQGRRVRDFVAWAVLGAEGFKVWARVFVSKSKGSSFGRLAIF